MIALFLCILFARAEIPEEYQDLAKRALENAKTKVPKDKRVDTAYPGDYSFPEQHLQFKLLRTLTAPTTKDIKGFAIQGARIAFVKRKAFNIKGKFSFVDPTDQQFYGVERLVASDEKVNIYAVKVITIFDAITNFDFHSRSPKLSIAPSMNFQWDDENDRPEGKHLKVGETEIGGLEFGAGMTGRFEFEFKFTWKSIKDIRFKAYMGLIAKAAAFVEFQDSSEGEADNDYELFKKDFKIKPLCIGWSFLGIGFEVATYLRFDALISDIRFVVPNTVTYIKGYTIKGSRTLEVSPYSSSDTGWQLEHGPIKEGNTFGELLDAITEAKFQVIPKIRLYLSVEVVCMSLHSQVDLGLQVPFNFTFGFDTDNCMFPWLYGQLTVSLEVFLDFSGLDVQYFSLRKFKKVTKNIIEGFDFSYPFLKWETGTFCLGATRIPKDSALYKLTHQEKPMSYYLVNHNYRWKTASDEAVRLSIRGYEASKGSGIVTLIGQNAKYYDNREVGLRMAITTVEHSPEFLYYISNEYGDPIDDEKMFKTNINASTDLYSQSFSVEIPNKDGNNILQGSATLYTLREKKFKQLFNTTLEDEFFSINIPCEENSKYALLAIDDEVKIDESAEFFAQTMIHKEQMHKVYYRADPRHYHVHMGTIYVEDKNVKPTLEMTLIRKVGDSQYKIMYTNKNFSFKAIDGTFPKNVTDVEMRYDDLFYLTFCAFPGEGIKLICDIKVDGQQKQQAEVDFDIESPTVKTINVAGLGKYYLTFDHIDSPNVTVNTAHRDGTPEVLTKVYDLHFGQGSKIVGSFDIPFEQGEVYKIINLTADDSVPLKGNYLIWKNKNLSNIFYDGVHILQTDTKILSVGQSNLIIPIRRMGNDTAILHIDYMITSISNLDNMNMEPSGYTVAFDNDVKPQAFIAPLVNGSYDFFTITEAKLVFHTLILDEASILIAVVNKDGRNPNLDTVVFVSDYFYFPENKLEVEYDTTHMENLLKGTSAKKFPVGVYCNASSVGKIRFYDKEYKLVGNSTVIDVDVSQIGDEHNITFVAVCNDETGVMCEIAYKKFDGYQLLNYTSRDGINITGTGMAKGVLHQEVGENDKSYYKPQDYTISILKNYTGPEDLELAINDIYPSDDPAQIKLLEEEGLPIEHNLTDAYREFCLYDSDGYIIPFSNVYFGAELGNFMYYMGIYNASAADFELSNEECLRIEAELLDSNSFSDLPSYASDLKATSEHIHLNTKGVSFEPVEIDYGTEGGFGGQENAKNEKKSNKTIIIAAAAAAAGVVVVAVVVVVVIVVVRRKRKSASSDAGARQNNNNYDEPSEGTDDMENRRNKRGKQKERNDQDPANEEDKYYRTLLV